MIKRIKATALLLAVILTFPGALGGSAVIPVGGDISLSTTPTETTTPATEPATVPTAQPTTAPTTEPTTEPTTAPTTEPATEPTTAPTTVPVTVPTTAPTTVPTTQATTQPATQPTTQAATAPPATTVPAPAVSLTASHAFIFNCADSSFTFIKGGLDDPICIASITKLFTAYTALKYLAPARSITVGPIIDTVPWDSSKASLKVGDVMTVEQLVYGMLLRSGSDAAHVLAVEGGRAIASDPALSDGDALAVFIAEMNAQAAANGMSSTRFTNVDGYHSDGHCSTMADMITLATLCLDNSVIRTAAATVQYTITLPDRELNWKNTNMLLHPDSRFYRPNTVGLKTGYTDAAGRCLLSAFLIDGNYILMGVFGCPDPNVTFTKQFVDSCCLYDTYIAN